MSLTIWRFRQCFFSPWKSKCLPWKFLSFFGFPSVKIFFLPWKYTKNCPWNTRSVRENFFQITYVKMGTCVREKFSLLFPWKLAKFTFFCTREKKFSSVKIIKISLFSSREKENPSVKKSKGASVKTLDCPWKCWKKCAWKPLCLPWKKSKKGRKWLSRALLIFTEKKKNAELMDVHF